MTQKNSIVLASATFGSFFLCAYSLQEINKMGIELSLPNICNYIMFGYSVGMIITISNHLLDSN